MKEFELDEIACPSCGYIQSDPHEIIPITYWGEDGWVEVFCGNCDVIFEVKEQVKRTYILKEHTKCQ